MDTTSSKNQESKDIIIDLEHSTNAEQFGVSNLIHRNEFEKVTAEINKRLTHIDSKSIALDTITILGGRGSGKTSFLLSLSKSYEDSSDVEVIDIIDPTMIEEKGHVFLTIISQIKKKVDAKLSSSDCSPESKTFCRRREWDQKLLSLAKGLPTIDGVGSTMDSWQDPEFIMDKGLKNVQSAMSLAKDFHALIDKALEILNKKVFVLMLDDIDIDFPKGWPVLETVRKYLTSPLMITLVSGDLRLFSKSIRKKQWKNFGKALLKNEGEKLDHMDSYNNLVTEMEGQYIQKVLKPQGRIPLKTLLEKVTINPSYEFLIETKANKLKLVEYYNYILGLFSINNIYQKECYRSFLMALPLRTQLQFLVKFKGNDNEEKNKEKTTDIKPVDVKPIDVVDVFLSDLYEKEVNIDLAMVMPKFINAVILDMLVNHKILGGSHQLQPTTSDTSTNSSLMALTLLFSQHCDDNKFMIFDYFVKVGYVNNLFSYLGYRPKNNDGDSNNFDIEALMEHSTLLQDRNTRDAMCYATSFMRAFFDNDYNHYVGSTCLYGLARKANATDEENAGKIDFEFHEATLFERQVAFIPASIAQSDAKQGTILTYSVYVLLGAISELAKSCLVSKNKLEMTSNISLMSQIRGYPMPSVAARRVSNYETSDIYSTKVSSYTPKPTDESEDELSDMLIKWIETSTEETKKIITSPYILGKISTRFFFAIKRIEAVMFDKLGDAMHRRIVAIMNAILVEDARDNNLNISLNNNNPTTSDQGFIDNLKKVNDWLKNPERSDEDKLKDKNALTFSKWMLSCPLFLLYLNNTDQDLKTPLIEFIGADKEVVIESSIYDMLMSVDVKSNRTKFVKSKFLYSKKNRDGTYGKLKQHINGHFFMTAKLDDVIEELKLYFTGAILARGVESFRKFIIEKKKQW